MLPDADLWNASDCAEANCFRVPGRADHSRMFGAYQTGISGGMRITIGTRTVAGATPGLGLA